MNNRTIKKETELDIKTRILNYEHYISKFTLIKTHKLTLSKVSRWSRFTKIENLLYTITMFYKLLYYVKTFILCLEDIRLFSLLSTSLSTSLSIL